MQTRIYPYLAEDARMIREEVFQREQGFQNEFDDIDRSAEHIVIFDGEQAAATGRVFFSKEECCYYIGRVAVRREYRGQGLGKMVIQAAQQRIRELGGRKVFLSGQVRVAEFYEKLGFQRQGEEYEDEGCPHVKLWKNL